MKSRKAPSESNARARETSCPAANHPLGRFNFPAGVLTANQPAPAAESLRAADSRFLLHGLVFRSLDGNLVHLSSHLLRHSFATEMADLNTPVEVIAKLLHQRDRTVTKYYARPSPSKVMSAAEMIFVDRIDLGAEGLRSPDEIGRMLKEAEGKVGALTEVFGGTCVVANMCPAKFVCVGCAGNAPDPSKRYQIDQKLVWAEQQLQYAQREKLVAEERQMKQLIADCNLIKEEMDLIEAVRKDAAQTVSIEHASPR